MKKSIEKEVNFSLDTKHLKISVLVLTSLLIIFIGYFTLNKDTGYNTVNENKGTDSRTIESENIIEEEITTVNTEDTNLQLTEVDDAANEVKRADALLSPIDFGKEGRVGDSKWVVTEIQDLGSKFELIDENQLNQSDCESQNGRFVRLKVKATNTSDSTREFKAPVNIVDINYNFYYADKTSLWCEKKPDTYGKRILEPGKSTEYELTFDVTDTTNKMLLEVYDYSFDNETGETYGYIDLFDGLEYID
ncbi:MAG: hypothetical protein Q9M91_03875 [Candidatus Dojkabacteria bacterium]|nr:hypothetical protein [Candidatus Dojkabacteria bacterium]MDQ7020951.1 hypothetical protein [Candidatus Dojkabacteria bacterium]